MGLYDRDYGRDDQNPYQTSWDRVQKPRSMTVTLIIINVVIFLISMLFFNNGSNGNESFNILRFFGFVPSTLFEPWMWWQFLTYGFFHDLGSIWHIVFNMAMLYVFGRMVESRMGSAEFLRFYLISIIVGGFIGARSSLWDSVCFGLPTTSCSPRAILRQPAERHAFFFRNCKYIRTNILHPSTYC